MRFLFRTLVRAIYTTILGLAMLGWLGAAAGAVEPVDNPIWPYGIKPVDDPIGPLGPVAIEPLDNPICCR